MACTAILRDDSVACGLLGTVDDMDNNCCAPDLILLPVGPHCCVAACLRVSPLRAPALALQAAHVCLAFVHVQPACYTVAPVQGSLVIHILR